MKTTYILWRPLTRKNKFTQSTPNMTVIQAKFKLTGKRYNWWCIYHIFLFLACISFVNPVDVFIQLALYSDSEKLFGELQKSLSHKCKIWLKKCITKLFTRFFLFWKTRQILRGRSITCGTSRMKLFVKCW